MEIGIKAIPYNRAMRKARKECNLTQQELGDLIGVSQRIISMIELLCRPVDEEMANEIALVLGYDVDYLFPPGTRNFKSEKTRSVEFVMEIDSLDALPQGEFIIRSPETLFIQKEFIETMRTILETLSYNERKVLSLRFGLGGEKPATLEETARHLGIRSRERIRELEAKALRRLRHPVHSRQLRDYLEELGDA